MKRFALCLSILGCLGVPVATLAQDECASAIPIFTGINPSPPLGVSGSTFSNVGMTTSADLPVPSCRPVAVDDIWFVYTALASGSHTFATCTPAGFAAGTHTDTVLQVLSGACGAGAQVGCDDDACTSPGFNSLASATLTAGLTYFVRVYSWDVGTADGSFYLTVTAPVPPPANDECTGAVAVFDGVNPSPPAGSSGTFLSNAGATTSAGPAVCTSFSKDVWFSYTATLTGMTVFSLCTPPGFVAGSVGDTVLQVTDGVCPPTTSLGCNDEFCASRSQLTLATTSGTVYLVRVASWSGTAAGTFYLSIMPVPPPPANDDCGGAIALAEGENGPFDNAFATTSGIFTTPAACAAGGVAHPGTNDVFFSYTAPCNGTVDIQTCDPPGFTGTNGDTQIVVHPMSDCPAPVPTVIACNDDFCGPTAFQSFVSFSMTAGMTYLVRVASWGAGGGTFKVTVTRHTASTSTVGPGCSDGGGPGPSLTLSAPPILGSSVTLSIAGAVPISPGMLFMSPPGPASPLPGGCTLYVLNGSLVFLGFVGTDGAGGWSLAVTVPSDAFLECVSVTLQAIILPSSTPPFYQVTDGLEAVLGY